jgi:two-component system chemotaxis response regulator CheY
MSRLRPDALFADLEMPGLDGLALITEMRRIPALATTPCLLITGHGNAETVRIAAQTGVSGFIVKPSKRDVILAKVRQVLPPLSSFTQADGAQKFLKIIVTDHK